MARGRPTKNKSMQPAINVQKLPITNEGDAISLCLEITRVSNGYIIKGWDHTGAESLMVFNGVESHRAVAGHVLELAIADMKQGEIINFNSTMTYTKKIQNNED